MAIQSSTGSNLLNLTLIIHKLIISYDAAHYNDIRLNVSMYWIIHVMLWYAASTVADC